MECLPTGYYNKFLIKIQFFWRNRFRVNPDCAKKAKVLLTKSRMKKGAQFVDYVAIAEPMRGL